MPKLPAAEMSPELAEACRHLERLAARELAGVPPGDPQATREAFRRVGAAGVLETPDLVLGGSGAVAAVAAMEALTAGGCPVGLAFGFAAHLFACVQPIARCTAGPAPEPLAGLQSGRTVAAHAISEPDSGSDVHSLSTVAVPERDGWRIDGAKCWITNAPIADVLLVHARTRPGGGYFGSTAFLVPATARGVAVSRAPGSQPRGALTGTVHLDGVWVPGDAVLGTAHGGAAVFATAMRWERVCLFGIYLGAMRRCLELLHGHLGQRQQFGRPLGSFQAVQHGYAELVLVHEQARQLLYRAARAIDAGSVDDGVLGDLAKVAVSRAALRVGTEAAQMQGAFGVLESAARDLVHDALPGTVFSGSTHIQLNNIARATGLDAGETVRRANR